MKRPPFTAGSTSKRLVPKKAARMKAKPLQNICWRVPITLRVDAPAAEGSGVRFDDASRGGYAHATTVTAATTFQCRRALVSLLRESVCCQRALPTSPQLMCPLAVDPLMLELFLAINARPAVCCFWATSTNHSVWICRIAERTWQFSE